MSKDIRPALRLDSLETQRILDQLDAAQENNESNKGANLRRSPRFSYRVQSLLIALKADNQIIKQAVPCRNLSREGLGFLLGRYVYPGTPVSARLVSEFNYATTASGRVVRCRYVPGTAGVYEVGLAFDRPIDIAMFHRQASAINVLLVDSDIRQAKLVERILNDSGARFNWVTERQSALEAANGEPFDLILVNMEADGLDTCQLIADLRKTGYLRSIITLTGLNEAEQQSHCTQRKCQACTPIELRRDNVNAVLRDHQCEPLVSSLAHDSEIAPLINEFVDGLPDWVREIEEAFRSEKINVAQSQLRRVKLFAEGCGFELLADAAHTLIALCDNNDDLASRAAALATFVRYCLAARPATTTAPTPDKPDKPNYDSNRLV